MKYIHVNVMMYRNCLVLLFIGVFLGCKSEPKKIISNNGLKEILIDPDKIKDFLDLSEILNDSINIIPLETTEKCLISEINRIEFYKNEIYISDRINAKVFVFTAQGKFIKSIGRQGSGPGEYSFLGDFTFKGDSIAIQDRSQNKYLLYSLYNGSYREVLYDALHLNVVSFDNIAYFISNYWPSSYGNFNLYKYDFHSCKTLSCGLPFSNKPIDKSEYGINRYASKCGNAATLIYPLNDTIYTLTKDSIYPSYVVHFTSRNLPEEVDVTKEQLFRYVHKNRYLKGLDFLQNSKDYLLGYYMDDIFNYFIYNKKESKISVGKWLKMNQFGNLIFHDFCTTVDNELCVFQNADILSSNWKLIRDNCTNIYYREKLDSIVKNMSDDSNPILFKCKFKNIEE